MFSSKWVTECSFIIARDRSRLAFAVLPRVRVSFDFLFQPFEQLDEQMSRSSQGAPLLVALALAFALGLRHASDPDHLVAVTSLLARDDSDVRAAARIGAWWGLGHARPWC